MAWPAHDREVIETSRQSRAGRLGSDPALAHHQSATGANHPPLPPTLPQRSFTGPAQATRKGPRKVLRSDAGLAERPKLLPHRLQTYKGNMNARPMLPESERHCWRPTPRKSSRSGFPRYTSGTTPDVRRPPLMTCPTCLRGRPFQGS